MESYSLRNSTELVAVDEWVLRLIMMRMNCVLFFLMKEIQKDAVNGVEAS